MCEHPPKALITSEKSSTQQDSQEKERCPRSDNKVTSNPFQHPLSLLCSDAGLRQNICRAPSPALSCSTPPASAFAALFASSTACIICVGFCLGFALVSLQQLCLKIILSTWFYRLREKNPPPRAFCLKYVPPVQRCTIVPQIILSTWF